MLKLLPILAPNTPSHPLDKVQAATRSRSYSTEKDEKGPYSARFLLILLSLLHSSLLRATPLPSSSQTVHSVSSNSLKEDLN